jgi:hypothetical protein
VDQKLWSDFLRIDKKMNRLPAVLQKEIWEYVRGDRAFWKTQYQNVINHLLASIDRAETCLFVYDISSAKSHLILEYHKTVLETFGEKFIKFNNRRYRLHASGLGFSMFADSGKEYIDLLNVWHKYQQLFLS